jgi:molybdopterin molybdotransferase
VKGAFDRAGVAELFWGVRIRPGKPLFCGRTANHAWAFGLPGNPQSCFVGFHVFVAPLLARMHGDLDAVEARTVVRTTRTIEAGDGRTTYRTATLRRRADGACEATPTDAHGSAMTVALALADAFIVTTDAARPAAVGDAVEALIL